MGCFHRHLESNLLESVVGSHRTINCSFLISDQKLKARLISPVMRLVPSSFLPSSESFTLVLGRVGFKGRQIYGGRKDLKS